MEPANIFVLSLVSKTLNATRMKSVIKIAFGVDIDGVE